MREIPIGNQPAASWSDPPFPVSPSGGKPGREGSPHAGARCAPAKAPARIMRRLPPQEGLPPPCASPARAPRRIGPGREAERIDSRLQRDHRSRLHKILNTTDDAGEPRKGFRTTLILGTMRKLPPNPPRS